jgi:ribosome biogenesis GTPase / thiamine phosphate phosphatase
LPDPLVDHGLLADYGVDDRVTTLYQSLLAGLRAEHDLPGEPSLARIVRVDRTGCLAVIAAGLCRVETSGSLTRHTRCPGPATGDWVATVESPFAPEVVAVLPRRSAIARRAPEDRSYADQVLAANVDVLAVISSLDRPISANRIERMLVLAWESGARPVVVLTKADVADDLDGACAEAEAAAQGLPVIVTSSATGEGASRLADLVSGGDTLALLGPSGAGKSSLVNLLVGDERQRTGDVRAADRRGRHTTTSRELVPVPGGGVLLDTPGLRGLGLLDAADGLSATFGDLESIAAECRFSDCAHHGEPGCKVQAAIEEGRLERRRLESYEKLQRELAREERRQPGAAGYAARREFRALHTARLRAAGTTRRDERRERHR